MSVFRRQTSVSLRAVSSTQRVTGQPRLHRERCYLKKCTGKQTKNNVHYEFGVVKFAILSTLMIVR